MKLQENELYRFDEEAAEKPIRFSQKFCRHFEGKTCAGKPFLLLDWQKQLCRDLFGWKRREDGRRRFQEMYIISAKGAGKTPLIAALGLYMLLADAEPGAHVISMASTFEQANLTFDGGKKYIDANGDLSRVCDVKQYIIKAPRNSKWTISSGKPSGRSGHRPSCLIADEVHEWPSWAGVTYSTLTKNMFKRSEPLTLVATNAGESKTSFAYRMHERALRVLNGDEDSPGLLPIIYAAPEHLDWRSEEAARAANPSLGSFVKFDQLAGELAKASHDCIAEQDYRRLYLTQWRQSAKKWLSLPLWESCESTFDPATIPGAVLYVGVDLSQSDDLCAAAFVYATAEKFYIDVHFWLPKCTAEKYEAEGIPYSEWAAGGWLTLLDSPTVNDAAMDAIAAYVAERGKVVPVKAVSYDQYRADRCIATMEAAGLTCVATRQGYSLTPGCEELDKRLKEQALVIAPNPALRAQADAVETTSDTRGNYWPVKPGMNKTYAGKRGVKIDGIVAIADALVEARKHNFPKSNKTSTASAFLI